VVAGGRVGLPAGVQIDPGGIGKGLAADLAVDLVVHAGAIGACVNVGGDLRVAGTALDGQRWSVTIEDPLGRPDLGTVHLRDEALVSSWRTRRTWGAPDSVRHHIIDPDTGAPAWSGLAGVTVLAPDAWWAEALATALFLAGPDGAPAVITHHGISALLIRDDGAVRGFGRLSDLAPSRVAR
jgi:thiamine biosynthesis lipoprotein